MKQIRIPDNITVKQLIETLKLADQDAVVTTLNIEYNEYSTIELLTEHDNEHYIDSSGLEVTGKIISLY